MSNRVLAKLSRAARTATLLLCVGSLSACVVAPYRGYGGYGDYGGGRGYGQPVPQVGQPQSGGPYEQAPIVVDVAPPAPYVEVIPVLPFLGALWIAGYWGWHGGRHHWVPGRYERPRPGYGWNAHGWVNQGGRWHLHGGGWVRR
jgi:WXXGXW repeat (2 copies)